MKKTDDISRWVPAPINGKDVVWSFIVDSLKKEHDVIENPVSQHVAMYGRDGGMAIAQCAESSIMIEAETAQAAEELAHAIADPINECEGNGDLFALVCDAELDEDAADAPLRVLGAYCFVNFYYTDINE